MFVFPRPENPLEVYYRRDEGKELVVQGAVCESRGGRPGLAVLKPVLNWANVCSPEHTSDTSTNYDSFLN